MFGRARTRDLTPVQVRTMLDEGEIALFDVREPAEFAAERIPGAVNYPLSTFDPKALPFPENRPIVFQCGSGKRSAVAVERCKAAGMKVDAHLAGGIAAWRAVGLPTVSLDPAGGAARTRG